MTPKDPLLEGTFWDKFWRPIRSRALLFTPDPSSQVRKKKKQPKHKVFGQDTPGTSGTQTSGYPRRKLYATGLFLLFLDREWPGCPGIWVGTSRIWKNFMQENFGLIFRTLSSVVQTRFREKKSSSLLQGLIFQRACSLHLVRQTYILSANNLGAISQESRG